MRAIAHHREPTSVSSFSSSLPGVGVPPDGSSLGRALLRGLVAGFLGTAAMTVSARARRTLYARRRGIPPERITEVLDYDDSEHVVVAASAVVRAVTGRAPSTPRGRRALSLLTHWGYGSAVAAAHPLLRRRLGPSAAGTVFLAGCQAMAFGLFPLLGDTPPPWRWTRGQLVTSLAQHALYASTVAVADDLGPTGRSRCPGRGGTS